MQAPRISRFAQFIITRFFRLWPIMIFCSILLLPSPMVPNRAAAPWTLLFASNHLPWNKQFMSWLWSIGVDVQYFVCAVVAMFACSFAPSRAPSLLTILALSSAIASVALSIQSASNLVFAPAGSELRVPMPVIGIDWMQEGAMNPAIDAFYSSLYLSAVRRCLPWLMGLAVAHLTTSKSSHSSVASRVDGREKKPQSLLFSALILVLFLLVIPCMNSTTAAARFLSPTHGALFLALHRPAFALFVAVMLVRYQNSCWQQQFMADRPTLCSIVNRLSQSSYAFMVLHPIIMGGAFAALDSHYSRQCPIPVALTVASGCCLGTLAAADFVTRYIHNPTFKHVRIFMSQIMPIPQQTQQKMALNSADNR